MIYGTLRTAIAGGAYAPYCEDMGFFFGTYKRCLDPSSTASLAQMTYNVTASAIGTVLPGIFDNFGMIILDPLSLAVGLVAAVLALAGLTAGPPIVRLIALVPLFNSMLGFALYRDRNLIIGATALAMLAGVGLWQQVWRNARIARSVRLAALLFVVALMCRHAIRAHRIVWDEVLDQLNSDPCDSVIVGRPHGVEFVALVTHAYRMNTPPCRKAD